MKKKFYRRIAMCCLLSLLLALSGCGTKHDNQDKRKGMAIYYTDKASTTLIPVYGDIKLTHNIQQDVDILLAMMHMRPKNGNCRLAITDKTVINSVVVTNNIAQVDFSTGYKKIAENKDLICRGAIVYTLTQLKGVNYVSFSVAGRQMQDTDGKVIGALNRHSFVFDQLPMK